LWSAEEETKLDAKATPLVSVMETALPYNQFLPPGAPTGSAHPTTNAERSSYRIESHTCLLPSGLWFKVASTLTTCRYSMLSSRFASLHHGIRKPDGV
jgi:hypothetical protein